MRVVFTARSRGQLTAIYRFIAERSTHDVARRYVDAIYDHCQGLALSPYRGTVRADVEGGLRIIGFRKRVAIAFAVDGDRVRIVGIYYGGQSLETLLPGADG